MMQEHILYDAQLTRSSGQPILIVGEYMDDKDIVVSRNDSVERQEEQPQLTPQEMVNHVIAQLSNPQLNIKQLPDDQLFLMLRQLQEAADQMEPSERGNIQDQIDVQQEKLKQQIQERSQDRAEEKVATQKGQFDEQLAEEWVKNVGDDLKIERKGTKVELTKDKDGHEVLTLPEKITLTDVIEAARKLGHIEGGEIKTAEKMQSFARQLKDATFFLARQKNLEGKPIFDDGVLSYLYDYAEQLRVLATGEGEVQKKTADAIREEAEGSELLPEYFEKNTDARRSLEEDPQRKTQIEKDYENHLFLFLLGKNHATTQVADGGVGSFYDRVWERYHRKERPEAFEEWIFKRKKILLSMLADYVNNGRVYTNKNAQTGLSEEGQKRAIDEVFGAISQRGKEKREELKIKVLEGRPEIQEQLEKVLNPKVDREKVASLKADAEAIRDGEGAIQGKLARINELVLDAYGLKREPQNANYSIAEALVEGEFGCSIQTLLMADLLKETYGESLLLMADTTVSGNTENELSGHIRLVAIDSKTGEGYFVDTHTGNEKGFERVTDITRITDAEFVEKAREAYLKAQTFSGGDFNLSLTLKKEDTGTAEEKEKIQAYEDHHNLSPVNLGVESAIWNNMAANLTHKNGQTDQELRQEKIHMVERALALNPSNAIAWLQLSTLNSSDQTRHNAFLQKAQALNTDVPMQGVEYKTSYTIDVYNPPLASNDPDVRMLVQRISRATDVNPIPGQPPLDNLELEELQGFREQVQQLQRDLSDQQAKQDLENVLIELESSFNTKKNAYLAERELQPPYSALTSRDFLMLSESPMQWLDLKFDALYNSLVPGQELSSPQISTFQSNFGTASGFVAEKFPLERELIERFNKSFAHRLNAMVMRTQVNLRNFDGIKQTAQTFGISGLLESMNMDDHRVEKMFNRITEKLDAERLLTGGKEQHLKPEVVNRVQEQVIEEELGMAKREIGAYGKIYHDDLETVRDIASGGRINEKDLFQVRIRRLLEQEQNTEVEKIRRLGGNPTPQQWNIIRLNAIQRVTESTVRQKIVRSVRFANDLVVCSQRDAVIASRGGALKDMFEKYRADVTGINAYNLEAFVLEKWGLLNHEEDEFFDYIKHELAYIKLRYKDNLSEHAIKAKSPHELEEIGTQQFRDLFAVPDLYSSGWRIDIFYDVLKEKINKDIEIVTSQNETRKIKLTLDKAMNMGLFMQLKWAEDVWAPGWDPMEKEFSDSKRKKTVRAGLWQKVAKFYPEEIAKLYREKKPNEKAFMDCFSDPIFITTDEPADGIQRLQHRLDRFLVKYNPVIQYLRSEQMDTDLTQLDLANLSADQKKIVDKALGAGEGNKLARMFGKLQEFALTQNSKGERVILNPLLNAQIPEFADIYTRVLRVDDFPQYIASMGEVNYGTLSQSQAGHDALLRAWNDNHTSIQAGQELVNFIKGGPVGDQAFHKKLETAEKFSGLVGQYNGGDAAAEVLRATAGTLLLSIEQDKLLDYLGVHHLPFGQPISKSQEIFGPGAKSMNRGELRVLLFQLREKLVKAGHSKEDADEIVNQLEERLGVTTLDMVKMQAVALILLLLMASVMIAKETLDLGSTVSGK